MPIFVPDSNIRILLGLAFWGLASIALAQGPEDRQPSDITSNSHFKTYLYLDNSFGSFWANGPRIRLDADDGKVDHLELKTGTGLASKRALGLMADTSRESLSVALFYASGSDEFARNRYRQDGFGLEFGYERDLINKFGIMTGVGLGAVRTKLRLDGVAFEDAWAPALTLSAGGAYDLSEWRSLALRIRSDLVAPSKHGWPLAVADQNNAEVRSRFHTNLEFVLRRRF